MRIEMTWVDAVTCFTRSEYSPKEFLCNDYVRTIHLDNSEKGNVFESIKSDSFTVIYTFTNEERVDFEHNYHHIIKDIDDDLFAISKTAREL